MAEARSVKCPNCSAPMVVPLGETELDCDFCDSRVRFLPGSDELQVVRTREEMKARERVALAQARMRQQLEQEEAERWRQAAAKVAIAALPVIGRSAGRAAFEAALGRRAGCMGCGCALLLLALLAATASALALVPLGGSR
jgi:hypothetical protein